VPFAFDVRPDGVVEWHATEDGARPVRNDEYVPSLYAAHAGDVRAGRNEESGGGRSDGGGSLADLRAALDDDPKVVAAERERKRTSLHARDPQDVLRIDVERPSEVRTLAREIRTVYRNAAGDGHAVGAVRLFDVDLAPQFRYCLATDTSPLPERELTTLSLRIGEKALADRDVGELTVDGESLSGSEHAVLCALQNRFRRVDPDVLVVSSGELIPLLYEKADEYGRDEFELGRRTGWRRLAGENTYESYGRVGHSPARYNIPGRAIVDESSSFLWSKSDLSGLLYLVEQSGRPLQETAWGSIGTVLTSMQISEARDRGVLAPWNKWEPERFKDVSTLHAADRGGFTFAPEVGRHEDVYEIDFASLYPNVICEYNVSPETVGCDCHADRADVPELGYPICDRPGFLPDVLAPLLADRAAIKNRLGTGGAVRQRAGDDATLPAVLRDLAVGDDDAALRAVSSAIKWVLVSCFGYQGYRNAKFGRIECHEAINAYAREIMLTAKERLEAAGWRVVHGIVDSLWVTPAENGASIADRDEPEPLEDVIGAISAEVDIELEFEGAYDWVCFVPRRDSSTGALTRYFGRKRVDSSVASNADAEYKYRGIELRQHSTPPFVADAQRDLVERLNDDPDPEAVCDRLEGHLRELRSGAVDPDELEITKRVSKRLENYGQRTQTVSALQRARQHDVAKRPGQSVQYVVVDDDARSRERVRLAFEPIDDYDAEFYADLLIRACESVTAPLGWKRERIRRYLRDGENLTLGAFE